MRTKESAAILHKVRESLAGETGIKIAMMFGSVASWKMSKKSDADVAVLFDRPLDVAHKMSILDRWRRFSPGRWI